MNKKEKKTKSPASQEQIFRIMIIMTFAVAGVFFLKNLIGHSIKGAAVIGISLAVLVGIIVGMKKLKVSQGRQQLVLAMCLVLIVFVISIYSGNYYSDDFPMFLAVIGLTGLYLEPQFTKIQIVLIDILFIAMYKIHPEKAGSTSQYFLCLVIFTLAASISFPYIKSNGR